jgi:hypothetical protein
VSNGRISKSNNVFPCQTPYFDFKRVKIHFKHRFGNLNKEVAPNRPRTGAIAAASEKRSPASTKSSGNGGATNGNRDARQVSLHKQW